MVDSSARLLGGRYEVRSLIGRGGMATVHLGRDTRLSRLVAIKMLRVDLARDAIFQTRFRREAQAAASLNHPNIVAVYDTGEEPARGPDGKTVMVPYIVMEYVEGHTVKELLSDGTPVPIPEAIEITEGVLSALEYAHGAGLVHRDIKPGNIMLTNTGKVKVMDFGIARALTDSQATMTSANAVVGTALYLSPEQARGERIDERSDVYSAGCVLFELLTGRAPFAGDSAVSLAYQHVSELPPVPSSIATDVPASLDRVVMKALAKDPEQRYASAADMAADLSRAAEGLPISAPPIGAWVAPDSTSATQVLQSPMDGTETMVYNGPTRANALNGDGTSATLTTGSIPVQAPAKKKKFRASVIWTWLLILLAAAMVGAVVWTFLNSGEDKVAQSETTFVPSGIVNSTQAEAKREIEAAGLVFVLEEEARDSDTVEKGRVAEIDPEEGTELVVGSEVHVYLSAGPASLKVPDVSGQTEAVAQETLEKAGFVVGDKVVEDSATVPANTVIRTDPASGSTQPRGYKINLYISSGNVQISSVVEMTEANARQILEGYGLRVERADGGYSDVIPLGSVVWMNPEGPVVPQGSTITLGISKGPEPTPEPPQSGSDSTKKD